MTTCYDNIPFCNSDFPQQLVLQRVPRFISVTLEPSFDLLRIYSPAEPELSSLNNVTITTLTEDQVYAIAQKDPTKKYIYTRQAHRKGITVVSRPKIIDKNIPRWKVPPSILNINAGRLNPNMIKQCVEEIYGTIDGLHLAYLEARIDIYNADLQEILKRLLVLGKRYRCNYKDVSVYIGKAPRHQIAIYDRKGRVPDEDNAPVRVESRIGLERKSRPYLKDWLEGKSILKDPFKKAFLVDVDALGFSREEKIAFSKCKSGLTSFIMDLSKKKGRNRKTVLQKHAQENIILNLNDFFSEWETAWHNYMTSQSQAFSSKPDLKSSYIYPEEEAV